MESKRTLPTLPMADGQVIVVEANPGAERLGRLDEWLGAQTESSGHRGWLVSADVERGGLWAGLDDWLEDLLPSLREHAPELLEKHAFELATILPSQRRRFRASRSLTDTAPPTESVRNYAIDRAYRIGHGVIDLLATVAPRLDDPGWIVVFDDYDRSGALVRRFVSELVRRRGRQLRLTLVLAVDPGRAGIVTDDLPAGTPLHRVLLDVPEPEVEETSPVEMGRRAAALESEVAEDPLEIEIHLPQLIRYWEESDEPAKALKWRAMALGLYNHYGFYEDALVHHEPVLANLDAIAESDSFFTRWNLVGSIFGCLVAVGEVEKAYRVVKEEAYDKIEEPADRARVGYVMSMLHARFLPESDLDMAEAYLQRGLEDVERAHDAPEQDRHFLRVFLNNGLALVRHRQGRPQEAIDLCREGYDYLEKHLSPGEHRLHRSVLVYNMAQVYSALRQDEDAIACFDAALEMDPNYSEYYNERGGIYLRMERYVEAVEDFRRAIDTSPPYAEVWTNLGQCYRQMGRVDEAVRAYDAALDVDPSFTLALVGRAEMLDSLGRLDAAEADYDALLALDPDQPMALANRAVIRYQTGRVEASLADLDAALLVAPEVPDLYHNRSFALADLGRAAEAAKDLETYLRLSPAASDRAEVEERLSALRATA